MEGNRRKDGKIKVCIRDNTGSVNWRSLELHLG